MVTMTERAAGEVRHLLDKQGLEDGALRLFVSGGGCSGLQYGMTLEASPGEEDKIFEQHGIKVVVDPRSYLFVVGSTVDYQDDLMGGGFKIDNPQAVASCGCGHSFQTSETQAQNGGGCSSH